MTTTMKVFEIRERWDHDHLLPGTRPVPEPGPGQVRLRMRAASLNWRDLVVPERGYGSYTGELPLIPVSDGVGVVDAVGPGVTRFRLGDRLCPQVAPRWRDGEPDLAAVTTLLGGPLDGTMAEWMCVGEHDAVAVPAHLGDEEAAALPCAALTAWSAIITQGRVGPGDRVLVQGTGGVALFALQFAKLAGASVTVISSSPAKLERARALGADATIDYRAQPEWARPAREAIGGAGYDHVVELGGEATLGQSLRAIRPGGTLSMIGVLGGAAPKVPLGLIVTRQVRLQGVTLGSTAGFAAMMQAIGQHRLRPVVERTFAFDELKAALAALRRGEHVGKICLRH